MYVDHIGGRLTYEASSKKMGLAKLAKLAKLEVQITRRFMKIQGTNNSPILLKHESIQNDTELTNRYI